MSKKLSMLMTLGQHHRVMVAHFLHGRDTDLWKKMSTTRSNGANTSSTMLIQENPQVERRLWHVLSVQAVSAPSCLLVVRKYVHADDLQLLHKRIHEVKYASSECLWSVPTEEDFAASPMHCGVSVDRKLI
jgi:hypothetical protein